MANILILILGHLCNAPRPQKEAETLANAGHDVIVYGVWFDSALVKRDRQLILNKKWRFEPIVDFQPNRKLQNWVTRIQSRLAREKYIYFGIFSPELLGYGAKAILKAALKAKADLTIVHSESGLWVGNQLLDRGYRVGVDFEDWFSEDLLPEARVARPIAQLKVLERRLINECTYCLTTSNVLAEALSKAYQAPKPTIIYNAFPWAERSQIDGQIRDRKNLDVPSIHWFSQTIGQGRGLETLFQSLPYIKYPIEIHLRGNYPESSRLWLESLVPDEWRDRLFIHPIVPNNELLSRIAEHDIGLALEVNDISSRNLTITNKFFQYLQAGLAIIATDTDGQSEILSQYSEIGELIPTNNAIALASVINHMLQSPQNLTSKKRAALLVAQEYLCWEKQESIVFRLTKNTLSTKK